MITQGGGIASMARCCYAADVVVGDAA